MFKWLSGKYTNTSLCMRENDELGVDKDRNGKVVRLTNYYYI